MFREKVSATFLALMILFVIFDEGTGGGPRHPKHSKGKVKAHITDSEGDSMSDSDTNSLKGRLSPDHHRSAQKDRLPMPRHYSTPRAAHGPIRTAAAGKKDDRTPYSRPNSTDELAAKRKLRKEKEALIRDRKALIRGLPKSYPTEAASEKGSKYLKRCRYRINKWNKLIQQLAKEEADCEEQKQPEGMPQTHIHQGQPMAMKEEKPTIPIRSSQSAERAEQQQHLLQKQHLLLQQQQQLLLQQQQRQQQAMTNTLIEHFHQRQGTSGMTYYYPHINTNIYSPQQPHWQPHWPQQQQQHWPYFPLPSASAQYQQPQQQQRPWNLQMQMRNTGDFNSLDGIGTGEGGVYHDGSGPSSSAARHPSTGTPSSSRMPAAISHEPGPGQPQRQLDIEQNETINNSAGNDVNAIDKYGYLP